MVRAPVDAARRARAPVVLALVVGLVAAATLPLAPAAAGGDDRVELEYTVRLIDPDAGRYRIEATFSDLWDGGAGMARITEITFDVGAYARDYDTCRELVIEGVNGGQVIPCSADPGNRRTVQLDDGQETLTYRYEVVLDVPAAQGGFNAYTCTPSRTRCDGGEWAVLQASGIGFQFSYKFFESTFDGFAPRLTFDLPAGWSSEGSFVKTAGSFVLEPAFPRPAGVFVLGRFDATRSCGMSGRAGVLVEIVPADEDVCGLVQGTAPYLMDVHGDHAGPRLLFAVAPSPFKSGGVAARDGFVVHADSSAQTIVHEFVHLWQRFEVCNLPPGAACPADGDPDTTGATVWIKEGGAEYYSGLALYAAGEWTPSRVQDFFDLLHGPRYVEGRLDQATYGSTIEDAAYRKGALFLGLLDADLRERTGKTADLAAVLRLLDAEAAAEVEDNVDLRESNADFEARLAAVAGGPADPWAERFDTYVYAANKPPRFVFDPTGTFRVEDLSVSPTPIVENTTVTLAFRVTNTGLERDTLEGLRVFVGGVAVHDVDPLTLDPGASRMLEVTFTAPAAGTHPLEVGTARQELDVLSEAILRFDALTVEPSPPHAREPYAVTLAVRNLGDLPGTGTVRLTVEDEDLGERVVDVPGRSSAAATFDGVIGEEGDVAATAVLVHDGTSNALDLAWAVGPPRSILHPDRLRESLPAPGAPLAIAALGAAAVLVGLGARARRKG